MLTVCSLNAERGGRKGFLDYIRALGEHKRPDVICLQEVHRSFDPGLPREVVLEDRPNPTPIRPHLYQELCEALPGYTSWFAPQIVGRYHDVCQRDVNVAYGQAMFVRENKRCMVIAQASEVIYRGFNEQNDEAEVSEGRWIGAPCAKSAQVATIHTGTAGLVVANVHGAWSARGKVDIPARLEQNQGLASMLAWQRVNVGCRTDKVLLLGDLNYVTGMQALENLRSMSVFGPNGSGVNLNHRFDVKETRTKFYPSDKQHREADFAIASATLTPCVKKVYLDMEAPSDHAAYFVEIDL